MDVATALSVAQTLFATLQCAEVRNLCSVFEYESELDKLLKTVETINSFLLDADSKCQELTHEGKCWVQNLKDAVYDADDLFDEYRTIAQQLNGMPGGKLSKKVRRFFSSKNPLLFAFKVNKLREKLDKIAKDHRDFGFSKLDDKLAVKTREETCSYVSEQVIIGRDADKETIVDLLLKDDLENNVSFVTVVGIGGLGKTALAQLVFSDHRIKEAFKDGMYWVCVSFNFETKDILSKILKKEQRTFEDLYCNVRKQIEGKRYMLVLDDVWHEGGIKWKKLRDFLKLGGKGSRILVTSRSQKVATAIGNYPIHKLQGLSEKDSWELFRKISLEGKEEEAIAGFDEIGRDIVKKCANVPLSIMVVASLLHGQDINAWQSYRRIDLAKMCDDKDDLMPILMFSYYHLDPALKSCFSFCSVFPHDHRIYKEKLISLWSAHGYLVPSGADNSIEDTGERYFSILLHRCFFQDVEKKEYSDEVIESVKMHDLIHDLARKVAGKESVTLRTCSTFEYEGNARHLFFDSKECLVNWSSSSNCTSKTLRTFCKKFYGFNDVEVWSSIISKCSRLRVLSIHDSYFYRFTDTLGSLLHLRYLDLSYNIGLEMLPTSITKLHNLQTLNLVGCRKLKELPEDTWKLVNLRVLDITGCRSLTHMPAGMGNLTSLHTLPMFIVCGDDDNLIDLKPVINNLRGVLCFKEFRDDKQTNWMDVKLDSFYIKYDIDRDQTGQKKLLEFLFCNRQARELSIGGFIGTEFGKLPSWATGLVSIELLFCKELLHLPSSLSQLSHLKYLSLLTMESMEYIEESDAPSSSAEFFPCLEELQLSAMPKLKGWWSDIRWMEKETVFTPSFPRLYKLDIRNCESLTYIPQCRHLKQLELSWVNPLFIEGFQICASLQHLSICGVIKNLRIKHLTNLNFLQIKLCLQRESLLKEMCHLTSLTTLKIKFCLELKSLPEAIKHLTSLTTLVIKFCPKLKSLPEAIKHLTSLTKLVIKFCPILKSLPEAIKHLTSLTTLVLKSCGELKSLPEAIKHLTSLNTLKIKESSLELKDRCQEPDGEDWLKICHIPNIYIEDLSEYRKRITEREPPTMEILSFTHVTGDTNLEQQRQNIKRAKKKKEKNRGILA